MGMSRQLRRSFTSVEVCAGAGGQALGLEDAGFDHVALVEIDPSACLTLRHNRPGWNVIEGDVHDVTGSDWVGVDLLAGGVPCPPFSVAGKQHGADDERDLFPEMLRLAAEIQPRGIMIENVRGLLGSRFDDYRQRIIRKLKRLGYVAEWRLLNACDFRVPQLRPRSILIALRPEDFEFWEWPVGDRAQTLTVGQALLPTMTANGWSGAEEWAKRANDIAPTLVGGSRKHGGADLGPTRARAAWAALDVNGLGIADTVPGPDHVGPPKLTVVQAAIIQGFPLDWEFQGRKTASYRQVGNAFPPPVAQAVGSSIISAWRKAERAGAMRATMHDDDDLRPALAAI